MLLPIAALAVLTILIAGFTFDARRRSVIQGEVPFKYYKVFRGAEPPDRVLQTTRNFQNLLETPILFYVVCLLAIVLKYETTLMVGLAWAYVALRGVHSYIHLTNNKVMHRLYVFAASLVVILVMFIILVINRGFA